MTAPAIEDLVADLRGIIADCTDPAAITARVAERCRPLADDQSWIEPEFYAGGGEQGFAVTVLHEEADQGLFIETVCWLPGRGAAPTITRPGPSSSAWTGRSETPIGAAWTTAASRAMPRSSGKKTLSRVAAT